MDGRQDHIAPSTIIHVCGLTHGFLSIFKIIALTLRATRATDGFGSPQMKGFALNDYVTLDPSLVHFFFTHTNELYSEQIESFSLKKICQV